MPATLGYWKLRGLAQHIRLMLEYTNTPYTEKIYEYEMCKGEENMRNQWMSEKFKLGMQFPNLPYYFDGNRKITQSNAICRYIARKNNLVAKCEDQEILCDMLENFAMDFRKNWGMLCYSSKADFEAKKCQYKSETMHKNFETLSKTLCSKKWFTGDNITYIDFIMYELIDIHRVLDPCCLNNYCNLKDFMNRFESLPAIKKYMTSCKFMKNPLNGAMAAFGGK